MTDRSGWTDQVGRRFGRLLLLVGMPVLGFVLWLPMDNGGAASGSGLDDGTATGPPGPSGTGDGDLQSVLDREVRYPNPDSFATNFRNYIWPTDASKRITSSFAEYRSTHFHGGIDISTNGSVGHRVYSVQDGYVYRIRIATNGYGKMLYVKHPDGFISTYAHLKSFEGAIAARAAAAQKAEGSFVIDLFPTPSELPVKRGDLIARTGDTGFGPPHLHFEIRDEKLNPVNPLLGLSFRIPDDYPPHVSRLAVKPLDAASTLNGKYEPRIITKFGRTKNILTVREKLRIRGKVGFGVAARDRANVYSGGTGVHSIELLMDGKVVYSARLNGVPVGKTKQVLLHYDLELLRAGKGKYQKLYVDEGNGLPFYDGPDGTAAGTGVVDAGALGEGEHDYVIRCDDIHGNRTEIRGTLIAEHPPEITIDSVSPNSITLGGTSKELLASVKVYGSGGGSWSLATINPRSFRDLTGSTGSSGVVIPFDTRSFKALKVVAVTRPGSHSDPVFYLEAGPGAGSGRRGGSRPEVEIDREIVGDDMIIRLRSEGWITGVPVVVVTGGAKPATVVMKRDDPGSFSGFYRLPDFNAGSRTIHAEVEVDGSPTLAEESFLLYSMPDNKSGTIRLEIGNAVVSFDSGAVFRPYHFTVGPGHSTRSLLFEPTNILLDRGFTVTFPTQDRPEKSAVYERTNNGWDLIASKADKTTFSGLLDHTSGEVAVMGDSSPPSIGSLRVRTRSKTLSFSFRYYDNLSGLDALRSEFKLDGERLIPEIDGEHRRVKYDGTAQLSRGKHKLEIRLIDRMGNVSETERSITIK